MANSRMYLACRHCGKWMCLAKGYYGDYYTAMSPDSYVREFNEFLDWHGSNCPVNVSNGDGCNCEDNARTHFIILEEGETYNPKTNSIEGVFFIDEKGKRHWDGVIKLPDEF